jgi:redox-sensitive bicupin YhaK (pirin superfamily)
MSNTDLIIAERSRDIGDFLVGRLIPFRKKRMVGPFVFIDHMGPTVAGPDKYLDVDQHPHVGLATLTYLLEGEIHHRDSIGSDQIIRPGSVNLMVAGRGVTHTERTPQALRNGQTHRMHGYQIWIALPTEKEEMEPAFHHTPADQLPSWEESGATFRLVAGKGFGKVSPVPTFSDLFMVEIIASQAFSLDIKGQLQGEIGICVVEGSIRACDQEVEKGHMLVSKEPNACALIISANSHLLLFGGAPFPEGRKIHWNFVASTQEKIESAKQRWRDKAFPKVAGDDTYVPLPGR